MGTSNSRNQTHFVLPKFRKGDNVRTPHGVGSVIQVDLEKHGYYYGVKFEDSVEYKYYAEVEIKKI